MYGSNNIGGVIYQSVDGSNNWELAFNLTELFPGKSKFTSNIIELEIYYPTIVRAGNGNDLFVAVARPTTDVLISLYM